MLEVQRAADPYNECAVMRSPAEAEALGLQGLVPASCKTAQPLLAAL